MKVQLPTHISERIKLLAARRTRETGRKVTPQSLARAVVAEYANARVKVT